MNYRKDIQGLRALSFILVFIFHLNSSWLPGGFIGVDLFFVISGFLMTTIITDQVDKKKFNFIDFFLNRFKRIVPAYYFLLLLTALVSAFIYAYLDLGNLIHTTLRALLFVSNTLFSSGNSYFGAQLNENPLLHTWSLAIEMQFYLILPILIYLFRKNILVVFIWLTLLITIYTTYQIYVLDHKSLMYFSLIARMPEFFIGGIFSLLFRNGLSLGQKSNNIIAVFSIVMIFSCCYLITETSPFPGILSLLPCISCAVLLTIRNNVISKFLSNKILVYIGELSYSLYLWHFPVMALIRYKNDEYALNIREIVIVILVTSILSWISYHFIENKFKKIETRLFFKILVPLFLLIAAFSISTKQIFIGKKIDKLYSERYFGRESHNRLNVQKFGAPNKNNKIILIGDSHAWSLKPFFDIIGKKNNFSFKTLTCDAFPAIEGIQKNDIPNDKMSYYNRSRTLVNATSKLINSSDIIILAIIGIERPPSEYSAIEKLCAQLKNNQKLILVNSFPTLINNPLKKNRGILKINDYVYEREDNKHTSNILKSMAAKYKNVYLYNLDEGQITQNSGYINDTVAYYDSRHINMFATKKLALEHDINFMKLYNEINKNK